MVLLINLGEATPALGPLGGRQLETLDMLSEMLRFGLSVYENPRVLGL
jgi:hypothetical protein